MDRAFLNKTLLHWMQLPIFRQTLDGDDLSPIPSLEPDTAEYASHLLMSLPWRLRPGADALVLEPRGGLDVLVGLAGGAGAGLVDQKPQDLRPVGCG